MLVFDSGQWQAFAKAAFVTRMGEVLSAFSGETLGMAGVRDIGEQLQRARAHGFTDEWDCARWVLCAWCLGQDFDRKIAAVADLLERKDVTPGYKALALEVMLHAVFVALSGHSEQMP
jgi:hypothetical protein